MTLKTKQAEVTKEDVEKNKEWIIRVTGRMRITPSKEERKDIVKRTVIYRCAKRETNEFMNPPLEEVRPTFQKLMNEIEFCSRRYPFRTLEYLFNSEEAATTTATNVVENDKWLLFSHGEKNS